jgi:uncharacterized protein YegL
LDIKILPDKNIPPEPFFGVWLMDISGSMAGDRIESARQSLIEQVNLIPEGTMFNLFTFETKIKAVLTDVRIDDNSRAKIIKQILKISERGTTSLYEAIKTGVDKLHDYVKSDNSLNTKKIILVSDGEPTDVPVKSNNENDPNYSKYFELAKEALEYRASIDTVAVKGHNVYLMYELAKRSTGKYIFAENEEELKTKMIIATEQTARIVFSQPTITIQSPLGNVQLRDAVQYKPTIIRMPFEKVSNNNFKAHLRSFEAGDTYQILINGKITVKPEQMQLDQELTILNLNFDFGEKLQSIKEIKIKFSEDPSKFKLNQDINKKYANVFSQAEEIADCTIRGDAAATQRIQGDETKKM